MVAELFSSKHCNTSNTSEGVDVSSKEMPIVLDDIFLKLMFLFAAVSMMLSASLVTTAIVSKYVSEAI